MTLSTPPGPAQQPAAPTLIPLTDVKALHDAGIKYPATVDGLRWLYRIRAERGMERAFRRVGRRVLIDVPAFIQAIREHPAQ